MLMISYKFKFNRENILIPSFALFFYATCIVDIFRLLGQSYIFAIQPYVEVIRNIIYIFLMVIVLFFNVERKINSRFFITIFLFIFFLGISILLNDDIITIIIPFMFYFLSRCLVGFYLVLNIEDYTKALICLNKFKWIMFIYSLLIIKVYSNLQGAYSQSSYMSISYNLLQISMVMMIFGKYFKRKIYYIYHFYFASLILIYGARGSLVCLVGFYIVLFLLTKSERINLKYLIYILIGILFGSIFIWSLPNLLNYLGKSFSFSRNLSLINTDNLFNYSNRLIQYEGFIDKIIENPFLFRGLLSDRFLMAELYKTEVSYNLYPHNIILEIIYQNGIVAGIVILVILFLLIIKKMKKIKKISIENYIFSLFIPVPFINLMFSGSYLISYTFWMALGYLLNETRRKSCEKSNN